MPNTYNNTTSSTTYYDDWKDSDHYHQLLFNDGRTLQARELTQLQTVINKDIQKFADNIFKDGAVVKPGGVTLNDKYEFVKLNTDGAAGGGAIPTSSYVGYTVTGATSGIQAKILQVVDAAGADPATLYVTYTDMNGGTQLRFTSGETLNITGLDDVVVETSGTSVGQGLQANIADGQYYTQGHFVYCEKQSVIVSKYVNTADEILILKIVEDVVTTSDDTGLFDNSGGTPNLSAPGADRYRIRLTLDTLSNITEADVNHIKIAKIKNNEVIRELNTNDAYNIPAEMIAKRIYENSGDYIIKPYVLEFDLDSTASISKLDAVVGPGTASVQGYRVTSQFDTTISIPRAQTTDTVVGTQIPSSYGNYVKVTPANINGLPNINTWQQYNLYTGTALGGAKVGKARVKAVSEDGGNYRFHLFDIDLDPGINFRNVQSLGDSADTSYFNITQENSKSVLYETEKNTSLFNLPYLKPLSFTNLSLTYQQFFSGTTDGSGNLTITVTDATNETFANLGDWLVVRTAGLPDTTYTISSGGAGSTSTVFAGLDLSTAYEIYAYVTKASNVSSRTKTLTTTTVSAVASETDSDGNTYYTLSQPDIYAVDSVRIASSTGNNVISRFLLDNGQRDNFYDIGRLVLRGGETAPSTIYAKFKHFEHVATGEFFSTRSYVGQVDYNKVPSYTKNNGDIINLNDVLDFRQVKNTSETFSGGDARVHSLPAPSDTVEADVTYYLPRRDRVIINKDGLIEYLQGLPSFNPDFPEKPDETMLLHNVTLNPYTLTDSDLTIERLDHRRYTMADIENIEKRVDYLEEVSALTTLETDLANFNVLDSAGVIRPKAGFFVDNFENADFGDIDIPDYRASVDPQSKVLRPPFYEDNIRLIYDSDESTNTIKKGSTVFLNHSETTFLENPWSTGTSNINPFEVIIRESDIQLSPSTDEWKAKEVVKQNLVGSSAPRFTIGRLRRTGSGQTGGRVSQIANRARSFAWNWGGTPLASLRAGQTSANAISNGRGTLRNGRTRVRIRATATVVSNQVIRNVVNERLVETLFAPFMRSRLVYFKVEGLRPNSRMFAYFDDVHVSSWVRQQSTFVQHGSTTTDYGDVHNTATQYPFEGGPTTLTTDATGKLIGSFFIPNTSALRFRTGTRQFKLLDVEPQAGQTTVTGFGDSVSRGTAPYTATGIIERVEQDVVSYRRITVNLDVRVNETRVRKDPIAQSFFINEDRGIWVTKIGVKFASKPGGGQEQTPVTLQIRPLVNGYPASNTILQGAQVDLTPAEITTSTDATTKTYFVFDEPVYLEGDKEYAFVLLANTTAYNVYISEIDQFRVGSTTARVNKNPVMGVFFASQNASTWSADQTKDITFEIVRAEFVSSGTAFLRNADVPFALLDEDPFDTVTGDSTVSVYAPNVGLNVGDVVQIKGVDSTDSADVGNLTIGGLPGTQLTGTKTITAVDGNFFQFDADSAADSDDVGGGTRVLATRNIPFEEAWPAIDIFQPGGTLFNATARFTTGKSLAGSETTMQKPQTFTNVLVNELNYLDNPKVIANRPTEVAQLTDPVAGDRSFDIKLALSSDNATVSPAIDLERSSLTTIHNVIDKQDSASTSGFNVPIAWSPESNAWGGSILAKHITKPIQLIESANGLKVILSANRPAASDFRVWYRTATSDVDIYNVPWVLKTEDTNNAPNEDINEYVDYEYLIGGLNGTLLAFTKFQLKIEMRTTNNTKVPTFQNLRVIALAE
jgi:hypothetical protein